MVTLTHFFKKISSIGLILLLFINFYSIALAEDQDDPLEAYNRSAFILNQSLDKHIFTPAAKTYKYIVPTPVRGCVTNFYSNINEVPTVINDLLQASFLHAMVDTGRFLLNSTIGVFGIFDVAAAAGLQPHSNDLSLTFAKWGWHHSAYFVLPLLGPSTIADSTGLFLNYFSISLYQYINPFSARAELLSGNLLNLRTNALDYENLVAVVSLDPYVFQRNAYTQRREYLIQQVLADKPFLIPNDTVPWKKDKAK